MSPEPLVAADAAAVMPELAAALDDLGYAGLYDLLTGGGLFVTDWRSASRFLASLGRTARAALALFAGDQAVPAPALGPRLAAVADRLAASGLARRDGETFRLDDLVVVPVLGGLLLTATPPGWRPESARSGRAYLGGDSLRLARCLPRAAGRSVLDIGAGCGVQGLLATRGASRVVLTDVEERSLVLARLNAALNGVSAEVRAGPGYTPVGGERFDLIVCLPPYVPTPVGPEEDVVFAGGRDGLDLLRTLIAGAGAHLNPGGELIAFAQLLCDDDGPLLARALPELAGPGRRAEIAATEWHGLHPYALELATRLAMTRGGDAAALRTAIVSALRGLGATGICSALVRVRATSADAMDGWQGDGAPRRRPSDVPVPAAELRFVEDASLRTVMRPGAAPVALPAPVAALLAACDGARSLDAVITAAWGAPAGAERADLLDEAFERMADLERSGLVRFAD